MTREEHWRQLLRVGGVVYEGRDRPSESEAQRQMIWHVTRRCRELHGSRSPTAIERYTGGHETATKHIELCATCAGGLWKQIAYKTRKAARRFRRLRLWITASVLAWPAALVCAWLQPDMLGVPIGSPFVTAVVQGIVIAGTLKWSSTIIKEWQRLSFLRLMERTSWRYMSMVCNEGDFGVNNIGIPVNAVKTKIVNALIADMKIVKNRCAACFGVNEMFRLEALIVDVERWIESMQEDAQRGAQLNPKIFRTAIGLFVEFSVNVRKPSGFGHMSMGMPGRQIWVGSQAARDAKVT